MTLTEYAIEAKRTCYKIGDILPDGTLYTPEVHEKHMKMGILTELGEVIDLFKKQMMYGKDFSATDLFLEVGDLGWYVVLWAEYTDPEGEWPDLIYPVKIGSTIDELLALSKYIINSPKDAFDTFWTIVNHAIGIDMDTVLDWNVEKLRKRYPEKFSPELAISRNDTH